MADNFQRIKISVNGQEVAAEIGSILAAQKKLRAEIEKSTISQEDYAKKTARLEEVTAIMFKHKAEIQSISEARKVLKRQLDTGKIAEEEYTAKTKELYTQLLTEQLVLKKVSAEYNSLNKDLKKTVITTEEFAEKSKKLANLDKLVAGFNTETSKTPSFLSGIVGNLAPFGAAVAGAFAVENIVSFGAEIFKTAVQMDTLQRKAAIVFGDSISIIEQFAASTSQSLGQSQSQTIAAATAIGDLLIPMGFARESAAVLSTQLVSLSGALSEWTGGQRSAEEVSQTLTKALLGEREELKGLGIAISEEDVKTKLAAEGKAKLTGKALEQAKALATLSLIMEKSVDAQTSFEQNSDSLVRSQARLESALATIKESLASAMIPLFSKAATAVSNLIAPTEKQSDSLRKQQVEFNAQIGLLEKGNISHDKRKQIVDSLNTQYGSYLKNQLTEKSNLEQIRDAQNEVNAALFQKIEYQAAAENLNALLESKKQAIKDKDNIEAEKARQKAIHDDVYINGSKSPYFNESQKTIGQALYAVISGGGDWQEKSLKAADKTISETDTKFNILYSQYQERMGAGWVKFWESITNPKKPKVDNGGGGGGNGDAESKLQDALDRLQELYKKHYQDVALLQVDEYNKGKLQIEQQYQDDIERADKNLADFKGTEADRVKLTDATTAQKNELLKLRDQEIDNYTKKYNEKKAKEATETENKRLEELAKSHIKEAEETKAFQEKMAAEKEAYEEKIKDIKLKNIQKSGTPEEIAQAELEVEQLAYQNAIDAADAYYKDDLSKKQEYIDAKQALEQAHALAIVDINDKKNKKIADSEKEAREKEEANFKARQQALAGFGDIFSALADIVGDEGEKGAKFAKALTLFQIAIDTASAISSLTKNSEGNPLNAPTSGIAGVIQFTTGLARILTNVARAKKLLTEEAPKRQKYDGGFEQVVGARDGITYNARHIPAQSTGLLNYSTPVVTASNVLANERGVEYFIAANDVKDPFVFSHIAAIESYKGRTTTTTAPQFADGGLNTTVAQNSNNAAMLQVLIQLAQLMQKIDNRLNSPNIAIINWDTNDSIALQKKLAELTQISSGKY